MADGEDWRRKRAEEMGLVDTGPWLGGAPRSVVRPAGGGSPPARALSQSPRLPTAPYADAAPDRPTAAPAAPPPPTQPRASTPVPAPPRASPPPDIAPRQATPPIAGRRSPPPRIAGGNPRRAWRNAPAAAAAVLLAAAGGWLLRDMTVTDSNAVPPPELAALAPPQARSPAVAPSAVERRPVTDTRAEPPLSAATRAPADPPRLVAAAARPPAPKAVATSPTRAQRDTAVAARGSDPSPDRRTAARTRTAEMAASTTRSPRARRAVTAAGLRSDARPSFDCRRAAADALQLVCGDQRLARLDRRMAGLYGQVATRARGEFAYIVDSDQTAFLNARNRCRSPACLVDLYQARIADLRDAGTGLE